MGLNDTIRRASICSSDKSVASHTLLKSVSATENHNSYKILVAIVSIGMVFMDFLGKSPQKLTVVSLSPSAVSLSHLIYLYSIFIFFGDFLKIAKCKAI